MKEVDLSALGAENQFDFIGRQWMLITAGGKESFNTMTASWGGFGWLWNKPVAGLTPLEIEPDVMTFAEARMTVQGRKIFQSEMKECDFIDKSLLSHYGKSDGGFHTVYVLEVEKVVVH